MRRILTALVLLVSASGCTVWESDALLAESGDVRIVWRTEQRLIGQGGHDPIPKLDERESQHAQWGDLEAQLWNRGDPADRWSRDDSVELTVDDGAALYRRNSGQWWPLYKGSVAIFQGVESAEPGQVPPLREVRAAIYRRQTVQRASFFDDARDEGDDVLLEFMAATLDARAHELRDEWYQAFVRLPQSGKAHIEAKLREVYRGTPNTFAILRAHEHLDLSDAGFDEANRAALLELERASLHVDRWGVHHIAKRGLKQLACSHAFREESSVVAVECPRRKARPSESPEGASLDEAATAKP
ncbi:MAG: hypothetical protein ACRBN8_13930 [Nannocystales bacterium]